MTAAVTASRPAPAWPPTREVVACLLSHDDRYLLLKRSREVSSDRGQWHCVTGFCEPGVDPVEQAVREVQEETGMPRHLVQLVRRIPLRLPGDDGTWTVHAFHFDCATDDVTLNWENDEAMWLSDPAASGLETVPWLDIVHRSLTETPELALCD